MENIPSNQGAEESSGRAFTLTEDTSKSASPVLSVSDVPFASSEHTKATSCAQNNDQVTGIEDIKLNIETSDFSSMEGQLEQGSIYADSDMPLNGNAHKQQTLDNDEKNIFADDNSFAEQEINSTEKVCKAKFSDSHLGATFVNERNQETLTNTSSVFTDVAIDPSSKHESPVIAEDRIMPQLTEEELNPSLAQFMNACQNGDLSVVTDLISSGEVQAGDTFSEGITGLHWAAINNRITIVRFLCENAYSKADPNKVGGTLLASPLHWACRNGLVYVVDYFLSCTNADPALKDSQNYNTLHLAVHSSNITLIIYLLLKCVLIDKTLYIDEPDNIQCTPLHWASYQGDILSVKALVHYGADVTKMDKSLMTPLHWGFIRGHKSVMAALLDAGSDIFHKNDKNKDSFEVAKDMNCDQTWAQVLKEADRNPKSNWVLNSHFLSPKAAKMVTFFTPYVTLPVAFQLCSFGEGNVVPKLFASALVFAASIFIMQKSIVPIYLREDKAIFQTPFLAGMFSATANWAVITWLFVIFPTIWSRNFLVSMVLAVAIVIFTYSFFKAMTINPGYVPVPSDPKIVFHDIKQLISVGKFDTENFCMNAFTRRPLRSKYSKSSKALVARFDHFCPWVYNEIGVRNHKLFITFVYSLIIAIVLYSFSAIEYFEVYSKEMGYSSDVEDSCWLLSDELCIGYKKSHFIFNLTIWCWFQCVWVSFLCIVQTFQICKGLTTWEFSSLDKKMSTPKYNHSTVPQDFEGASHSQSHGFMPGSHGHSHKNGLNTCIKLLGLDQFIKTLKAGFLSLLKKTTRSDNYASMENFDVATDYGVKQNWLDFWFIGEITWRNLLYLPIDGENNLNGETVDYYRLFEYPKKISVAEAV